MRSEELLVPRAGTRPLESCGCASLGARVDNYIVERLTEDGLLGHTRAQQASRPCSAHMAHVKLTVGLLLLVSGAQGPGRTRKAAAPYPVFKLLTEGLEKSMSTRGKEALLP